MSEMRTRKTNCDLAGVGRAKHPIGPTPDHREGQRVVVSPQCHRRAAWQRPDRGRLRRAGEELELPRPSQNTVPVDAIVIAAANSEPPLVQPA